MKFKTTNKAVRANYNTILKIGYCGAQYLLNYETPVAYTSGTNGWNSDIYEIAPDIAISTGYAPIGTPVDYDLLREYEKKAEKIVHGNTKTDPRKRLQKLIRNFTMRQLAEMLNNE